MTVDAGCARGRNLVIRHDWSWIVLSHHHQQLNRSVNLSVNICCCRWCHMTVRASHIRMGRHAVRNVFRRHDVTACSAERYGVHVGNTPIGGSAHNDEIYERCDYRDVQSMSEHRIFETDFWKERGHLVRRIQIAASQKNSDQDQKKTNHKNARKDQVENDAEVRILRSPASEKADDPEAEQDHCRRCCGRSAKQAKPIIPVEEDRSYPLFTERISDLHSRPRSRSATIMRFNMRRILAVFAHSAQRK